MNFDVSICQKCFWYNKSYCEAEYNKRAYEVYENCNTYRKMYVKQLSIDDLLQGVKHDNRPR